MINLPRWYRYFFPSSFACNKWGVYVHIEASIIKYIRNQVKRLVGVRWKRVVRGRAKHGDALYLNAE